MKMHYKLSRRDKWLGESQVKGSYYCEELNFPGPPWYPGKTEIWLVEENSPESTLAGGTSTEMSATHSRKVKATLREERLLPDMKLPISGGHWSASMWALCLEVPFCVCPWRPVLSGLKPQSLTLSPGCGSAGGRLFPCSCGRRPICPQQAPFQFFFAAHLLTPCWLKQVTWGAAPQGWKFSRLLQVWLGKWMFLNKWYHLSFYKILPGCAGQQPEQSDWADVLGTGSFFSGLTPE